MKALMVFCMIVAAVAVYGSIDHEQLLLGVSSSTKLSPRAHSFIQYRNAVDKAAFEAPLETNFSASALNLPVGWKSTGFYNRIDGDVCYVWGDLSLIESRQAMRLVEGSYAIGININGHLVAYDGTSALSVPSWIPNEYLVSAINIQ